MYIIRIVSCMTTKYSSFIQILPFSVERGITCIGVCQGVNIDMEVLKHIVMRYCTFL